jgi:hypothetical protein
MSNPSTSASELSLTQANKRTPYLADALFAQEKHTEAVHSVTGLSNLTVAIGNVTSCVVSIRPTVNVPPHILPVNVVVAAGDTVAVATESQMTDRDLMSPAEVLRTTRLGVLSAAAIDPAAINFQYDEIVGGS